MATNVASIEIDNQRVSESLRNALANMESAGQELVLDFSSVNRIDAGALSALAELAGAAEGKGGDGHVKRRRYGAIPRSKTDQAGAAILVRGLRAGIAAPAGYSYRSASTGSSRAARPAGQMPKNRPTPTETRMPAKTAHNGTVRPTSPDRNHRVRAGAAF